MNYISMFLVPKRTNTSLLNTRFMSNTTLHNDWNKQKDMDKKTPADQKQSNSLKDAQKVAGATASSATSSDMSKTKTEVDKLYDHLGKTVGDCTSKDKEMKLNSTNASSKSGSFEAFSTTCTSTIGANPSTSKSPFKMDSASTSFEKKVGDSALDIASKQWSPNSTKKSSPESDLKSTLNSRNVSFTDMMDQNIGKDTMYQGKSAKRDESMDKKATTFRSSDFVDMKFSETDAHTRKLDDSLSIKKKTMMEADEKIDYGKSATMKDLDANNSWRKDASMDDEKSGSMLETIQTGAVEASKFVIDNTTSMLNKLRDTIAGDEDKCDGKNHKQDDADKRTTDGSKHHREKHRKH